MNREIMRVLLLCIPLTGINACGGGAGGGSGGAFDSGIEGSGQQIKITSAGAVTAKGSIFVNGVEYDLTGASITLDGGLAAESDIDVGSIVIVEGTLDADRETGSAERVTAGIAVAGPIASVDLALERITVLGQIIQIDPSTLIADRLAGEPLGGLRVNDDVEVSGFADSTGLLFARRLAARQPDRSLQVTGYITNLDAVTQRFTINGQAVDFASAMLIGLDQDELDGARVRVTASALDSSSVLLADELIYVDPALPGDVGDMAQLQGWVTRFGSESDFDVDGHPVITTDATEIESDGADELGVVRLDAFLNVRGRLVDGGIVEALDIVANNVISLDSVIDRIDGAYVSAELVPWAGHGCQVVAETVFSIDGRPATLADLEPGDVATIYAHYVDPRNYAFGAICQIIAVEHNVRGPLESKPTDSASLQVMGQRVWLNPAATVGDRDGPQGFDGLAALQIGDMVEVSGHTTAEGEVLADGIHLAEGEPGYQVIGFVEPVDGQDTQFRMGDLLVDYAGAAIGGFPGGMPVAGDRAVVIADTAPSDGLLSANIVRYAAAPPRGANANFVRLNGLVTRYDDQAGDLYIEGRKTVSHEWPDLSNDNEAFRCDWSKVHVNLNLGVTAVGIPRTTELPDDWRDVAGELVYLPPTCPAGRWYDDRIEASSGGNADLELHGLVQSVDLVSRSMRVAGITFMLHPATLLTNFQLSADSNGVTTPRSLEDIAVGDRVQVYVKGHPLPGGVRPVDAVWTGQDWTDTHVWLDTQFQSFSAPDELVLYSDIRVKVAADTTLFANDYYCDDTIDYENPTVFFADVAEAAGRKVLWIRGNLDGEAIVAESVYWNSSCAR